MTVSKALWVHVVYTLLVYKSNMDFMFILGASWQRHQHLC